MDRHHLAAAPASPAGPQELQGLATALASALDASAEERQRGEEYLQAAAASPSFCPSLLALTHMSSQLPDPLRLLAATQLKNETVRLWRRGAHGSRASDRDAMRAALIFRLSEPESCEPVGVQIAVAVARVMRSEANVGEATVLQAFSGLLARTDPPDHALLALLYTTEELPMRLPAQHRLAARIGHVMLGFVGPMWEAALAHVTASAAELTSTLPIRTAVLRSKLLRQLIALAAIEDVCACRVRG